jgi:hypothetical protein
MPLALRPQIANHVMLNLMTPLAQRFQVFWVGVFSVSVLMMNDEKPSTAAPLAGVFQKLPIIDWALAAVPIRGRSAAHRIVSILTGNRAIEPLCATERSVTLQTLIDGGSRLVAHLGGPFAECRAGGVSAPPGTSISASLYQIRG